MTKLDEAVKVAKDFLGSGGIYGTSLEEISLKDKRWVVILSRTDVEPFEPCLFVKRQYTVELDAETGDIVGFKKEKAGA